MQCIHEREGELWTKKSENKNILYSPHGMKDGLSSRARKENGSARQVDEITRRHIKRIDDILMTLQADGDDIAEWDIVRCLVSERTLVNM